MNKLFEWLSSQDLKDNQAWWEIYQTSFPANELDDKQLLLSALKNNIVRIGCYRHEANVIALAVVYPMKDPHFQFLHYFAVAKSHRNQGLGGILFDALLQDAFRQIKTDNAKHLGLVWEVEDPLFASSLHEKKLWEKRIEFYKRHGGEMLSQPFIQPPIDGETTVPMRLMFCSALTSNKVHENAKQIAKAIYFQKYHVVNKIKAEILNELLARCHP